jgi:hypothetical protein
MNTNSSYFLTHTEGSKMATDKLFKVFGTSKLDGETKVRFANDIMRTKVLAKHGHTEIELVELSEAVTKYEGVKQIQAMDDFADAAAQSAIAEYLDEKAPKTAKTKSPAAKPAKAAPKAKATAKVAVDAELEDAPV